MHVIASQISHQNEHTCEFSCCFVTTDLKVSVHRRACHMGAVSKAQCAVTHYSLVCVHRRACHMGAVSKAQCAVTHYSLVCVHRRACHMGAVSKAQCAVTHYSLDPLTWYVKTCYVMSLWASVGVSMATPPFTMTSFQSAFGQVVAWFEYSSVETDSLAGYTIVMYS